MSRRVLAVAGASCTAAVLAAGVSLALGAKKNVFVGDNFFEPAKAKVAKGDSVVFEWIGSEEHELAKSKGPGKFFHSGPIAEGEFRQRFRERGTYLVICTLHEDMRMKVEVN